MPILAFHNIDEGIYPGINTYSPTRFRSLISVLIDHGFRFVRLSEVTPGNNDDNQIAITFDDGYESFHRHVAEILADYSIPATIFMPAGYIGKSNSWDYGSIFRKSFHLSAVQIRELVSSGVEFGSHGLTHTTLVNLGDRMLRIELERSKTMLEDITGRRVNFLSYPFGRFSKRVEECGFGVGYLKGFSLSHFGKKYAGFTMPRSAIYLIDTPYSVFRKISGGAGPMIERSKGAIINSYASCTIWLNRLRMPARELGF